MSYNKKKAFRIEVIYRYLSVYIKVITDLKYVLAYSAQSKKPLLFLHIVSLFFYLFHYVL